MKENVTSNAFVRCQQNDCSVIREMNGANVIGKVQPPPALFLSRLHPQPELKYFNLSLCQNFPPKIFFFKSINEEKNTIKCGFFAHPHHSEQNQCVMEDMMHLPVPQGWMVLGGDCGVGIVTGTVWGHFYIDRDGVRAFPGLKGCSMGYSPQTSSSSCLEGAELPGVCWTMAPLLAQGEKMGFGLPASAASSRHQFLLLLGL